MSLQWVRLDTNIAGHDKILELDFDAGDVLPGHLCKRPPTAYPLWQLPKDIRESVAEAVAQPKPPKKWLDFGLAQIPSRGWFEWHWQRGIDPNARRDKIPSFVRAYVMERDEMVCGLCGYFVDEADLHLDHIVPHSLGGGDGASNLQVSHAWCNLRKGARV